MSVKTPRPLASSPAVSERMRRAKETGTGPELALRRGLHRSGLRFQVQYHLPELPRRTIDIAFPHLRIAVFVDGCFWHGCTAHRALPRNNAEWWAHKLALNRARDRDTDERLAHAGWIVMRFWEHDDAEIACAEVRSIVASVRAGRETRIPQLMLLREGA